MPIPSNAKLAERYNCQDVKCASLVYFLMDGDECVYVGTSRNLTLRVIWHRSQGRIFDSVRYLPVPMGDRRWVERQYIRALRPKYNRDAGDEATNQPATRHVLGQTAATIPLVDH